MRYVIIRAIRKSGRKLYGRVAEWMEARITEQRRRAARENLSRFPTPYKLHFGCGRVRLEGWVNIDLDGSPAWRDIIWDVTKPFPIPDKCCSYIYHEHLLEHLKPGDGLAFLKDCHRLLVPGGVLRVAMPSLEYTIEKYLSDDWRNQDWLHWPEYQFIQTRAEMFNIAMRWWGHLWLYDAEELQRRLKEAGFQTIIQRALHESDFPELRRRETRPDSKLIYEAIKSGNEWSSNG